MGVLLSQSSLQGPDLYVGSPWICVWFCGSRTLVLQCLLVVFKLWVTSPCQTTQFIKLYEVRQNHSCGNWQFLNDASHRPTAFPLELWQTGTLFFFLEGLDKCRHTSSFCTLLFMLHGCFSSYKLKARRSTNKKITTHFIMLLYCRGMPAVTMPYYLIWLLINHPSHLYL